jgi:glycosyltransferase involved in cell wall biosynthesis
LAALIGRLRGIPVVLRADWNGTVIIGNGLKGLYDRYLKFPTLTNSSRILVFSKKQKTLMESYGINGDKIEVVPNGVNYEEFSSVKSSHLRSDLKLGPKDSIILTVCRITRGKNPELAIRTLAKIGGSLKNAIALIVGQKEDAEYCDYLTRLVAENGLEGRVIFLLEIDHKDMPMYYSAADIFFLTSKPVEGMNLSTVEAMCAGLPIITTEVSVTSEIVEEAECGFVIKNEDDAARNISYLLSNEKEMKRIGENGRAFAKDNLSWETLTGKIEQIMLNLSSLPKQ